MEKKTNYLEENFGIFYTEEEELTMRINLAELIKETIVKFFGRKRIPISTHTSYAINDEVSFEIYYFDLVLYVNVLHHSYIKVCEYIPNVDETIKDTSNRKGRFWGRYETDETIIPYVLSTLEFNLENYCK